MYREDLETLNWNAFDNIYQKSLICVYEKSIFRMPHMMSKFYNVLQKESNAGTWIVFYCDVFKILKLRIKI